MADKKDNSGLIYQTIKKLGLLTKRVDEMEQELKAWRELNNFRVIRGE